LLDELPELLSIKVVVCFYGASIEAGALERLCMSQQGWIHSISRHLSKSV
jgi:hypothetical protein